MGNDAVSWGRLHKSAVIIWRYNPLLCKLGPWTAKTMGFRRAFHKHSPWDYPPSHTQIFFSSLSSGKIFLLFLWPMRCKMINKVWRPWGTWLFREVMAAHNDQCGFRLRWVLWCFTGTRSVEKAHSERITLSLLHGQQLWKVTTQPTHFLTVP